MVCWSIQFSFPSRKQYKQTIVCWTWRNHSQIRLHLKARCGKIKFNKKNYFPVMASHYWNWNPVSESKPHFLLLIEFGGKKLQLLCLSCCLLSTDFFLRTCFKIINLNLTYWIYRRICYLFSIDWIQRSSCISATAKDKNMKARKVSPNVVFENITVAAMQSTQCFEILRSRILQGVKSLNESLLKKHFQSTDRNYLIGNSIR